MRGFWVAFAATFVCVPTFADEISVSFNGDAARFEYAHDLSSNPLQIDAGWMHESDNGDAIHVGLNLADFASDGVEPVKAGLGGRLVYTNGDDRNQDGFALALGGFVRYAFPRFNRIAVTGKAYFAPGVLSIGEMEKYQDYTVDFSYNVTRQADVYVGARYVRGDYDDARDAYYDTGMHIGISLRF